MPHHDVLALRRLLHGCLGGCDRVAGLNAGECECQWAVHGFAADGRLGLGGRCGRLAPAGGAGLRRRLFGGRFRRGGGRRRDLRGAGVVKEQRVDDDQYQHRQQTRACGAEPHDELFVVAGSRWPAGRGGECRRLKVVVPARTVVVPARTVVVPARTSAQPVAQPVAVSTERPVRSVRARAPPARVRARPVRAQARVSCALRRGPRMGRAWSARRPSAARQGVRMMPGRGRGVRSRPSRPNTVGCLSRRDRGTSLRA